MKVVCFCSVSLQNKSGTVVKLCEFEFVVYYKAQRELQLHHTDDI